MAGRRLAVGARPRLKHAEAGGGGYTEAIRGEALAETSRFQVTAGHHASGVLRRPMRSPERE